ncbi:DHS-like NAD/FAD-binding domain-containing protein [Xylaria bambusicola]|uniref:DHS-like NAD/FAD-binding domain-containing protein n=1 Tax=Xylaria bambusicola TaxID=326684 RepID=UPI0020082382|nr:DHS-like NAD/FAD-binding domain-containing protein [Xylaria bambusicola]KAI0508906.1 DHS-like NAD/FAD-binding domain-containing protein [Xylaria bambusicola]
MPTLQITPDALDRLQDVADILAKSRKVVIITGAGISTNSGIPDFRSENGLYSLIQDQFERAEANATTGINKDEDEDEDIPAFPPSTKAAVDSIGRPMKRRRTSGPDNSTSPALLASFPLPVLPTQSIVEKPPSASMSPASYLEQPSTQEEVVAPMPSQEDSLRRVTRSQATALRPTLPRHLTQHSVDSSTSHDSFFSDQPTSCESPQTDTSILLNSSQTSSHTQTKTPRHPTPRLLTSSSPLSSPPSDPFDPYENAHSSTENSSHEDSDCSDTSESDDTQQSLDLFSSQASTSNLRNMKGRDLFDCNIWADPLKTSVFYRFATSLRQRVKEVEPTITHRFIAQMRDIGKLARVYTQNIDEIEKKIGLSTDLKHGYGSKKRKSIKQYLPESPVKEEATQQPNEAATTNAVDVIQTSPRSGDAAPTQTKPRPSLGSDKGVECVFLHGSLHSLRCFVCGKLCDWDEDGRESCTLLGEQPECPHCAGATAARQEKGKRALGVGKLRPDIVLYGEEHPQSDLISPIVQHDLATGPDLLLVLGTSLRVHGLKVMVKEFAKAVHKKGGKVVFINFTKPSESVWGDVLDYWIEWDCDAWVEDLRNRKPLLWLSPEERLEMDRQRRETLAERKKEKQKKRESINGKKREDSGGREQPVPEPSKPRVPPKNPVAMRNDYQCGAYVIWDIFQTLAKIGDRPFNNLGYIPPASSLDTPLPPPSSSISNSQVPSPCEPGGTPNSRPSGRKTTRKPLPRRAPRQGQVPRCQPNHKSSSPVPTEPGNPGHKASDVLAGATLGNPEPTQQAAEISQVDLPQAKRKKARKSAPAALTNCISIDNKKKPVARNKRSETHSGKDRYLKAARELARSGKTPSPGCSAMQSRLPATPRRPFMPSNPHDLHLGPYPGGYHFVGPEDASGSSRRHSPYTFDPYLRLLPLPPSTPALQHHSPLPVSGRASVGSNMGYEVEELPPELPPIKQWGDSTPSPAPLAGKIAPMEIAPLVGPVSPLVETWPKTQCSYAWHHSSQPIYNDPLVGISRQATANHKHQWPAESNNDDNKTPSPSEQLRMEAAATQLWRMRGAT